MTCTIGRSIPSQITTGMAYSHTRTASEAFSEFSDKEEQPPARPFEQSALAMRNFQKRVRWYEMLLVGNAH
jgi:hypothetical protein